MEERVQAYRRVLMIVINYMTLASFVRFKRLQQ